jgi:hypothetical protein
MEAPLFDTLIHSRSIKTRRLALGQNSISRVGQISTSANKELLPQLDPETFWQVHRSAIVRARVRQLRA